MPGKRSLEGVKDAIAPEHETTPVTSDTPFAAVSKVKDVEVIVTGLMFSLKVTVIILLRGISLVRFTGSLDITRGYSPRIFTLSSFLHPAIKTNPIIARVINSFSGFIFLF